MKNSYACLYSWSMFGSLTTKTEHGALTMIIPVRVGDDVPGAAVLFPTAEHDEVGLLFVGHREDLRVDGAAAELALDLDALGPGQLLTNGGSVRRSPQGSSRIGALFLHKKFLLKVKWRMVAVSTTYTAVSRHRYSLAMIMAYFAALNRGVRAETPPRRGWRRGASSSIAGCLAFQKLVREKTPRAPVPPAKPRNTPWFPGKWNHDLFQRIDAALRFPDFPRQTPRDGADAAVSVRIFNNSKNSNMVSSAFRKRIAGEYLSSGSGRRTSRLGRSMPATISRFSRSSYR
jgi:hypothetical protein